MKLEKCFHDTNYSCTLCPQFAGSHREGRGVQSSPQPAVPSSSTFHSSFCIRYLLFLFFSHLQEFTALRGVLKQNNHCYPYGQRHIRVPAFTKVLSLFQTRRNLPLKHLTTSSIYHNLCYSCHLV